MKGKKNPALSSMRFRLLVIFKRRTRQWVVRWLVMDQNLAVSDGYGVKFWYFWYPLVLWNSWWMDACSPIMVILYAMICFDPSPGWLRQHHPKGMDQQWWNTGFEADEDPKILAILVFYDMFHDKFFIWDLRIYCLHHFSRGLRYRRISHTSWFLKMGDFQTIVWWINDRS